METSVFPARHLTPHVPTLWLGDIASQAWAELARKVVFSAPLVTRGAGGGCPPCKPTRRTLLLKDSASLLWKMQKHNQKGKN